MNTLPTSNDLKKESFWLSPQGVFGILLIIGLAVLAKTFIFPFLIGLFSSAITALGYGIALAALCLVAGVGGLILWGSRKALWIAYKIFCRRITNFIIA